jgi:cytochrome P450
LFIGTHRKSGDTMRLTFDPSPSTSLPTEFVDLLRRQPTLEVEMPDGTAAIAVTRHCDVRSVLRDKRFSRAQFGTHTLWEGSDLPLALSTTDPPIHTHRRRAIQAWFTAQRAEQARPFIERVADQLIDDVLAAGPPADIYRRFCHPFPNLVHMNLLGLDTDDLPYLAPRMTVAWSCGYYPADQVAKATLDIREYFESQVIRSRRGGTARGLIDALVRDESANKLPDAEIVMLTMNLLMSGAETSSNHLALGLVEILQQPGLADVLRRNPGQIPTAVEELLRWVWFAGTYARAHVALADVRLYDRLISKGEVVVPIMDVANRDPDVFPDADELCPQRSPNPHLGFGYGQHRCVGMAFSRLELQVGLRVVLSRLDGLALVADSELDWRTNMLTRGVWSLPVTWGRGAQ